MAINTKAETRDGTEQYAIKNFVDLIRPQIEGLGYKITTQANLPYTNFCDRLDVNGKGLDYGKGKKSYAVDVLIYRELENDEKVPLVVVEGKIRGYSTHDIITYSEKARTHKSVFPHIQYGFIVLDANDDDFMPLRYYLHSTFDFEEIFPNSEASDEQANRINSFIRQLEDQIKIAERKHKIFFH